MRAFDFRLPAGVLVGVILTGGLAAAEVEELLEKKTYTDAKGKTLRYRLLRPADIEEGKKYPLVVFLHGAGERGDDNTRQLRHGVPEFARQENRAKYPCFLIAPQCPREQRWVEVDWGKEAHRMPAKPAEQARLVLALVDQMMKELPIDPDRVYITGLSMGGFGTWDLLMRRPDLFAAGVPICGGGDETRAKTIVSLPIWVFHGAKDRAVKVSRSRTMVEALKQAGGMPRYTEYPDVGHDSWTPAYRDEKLMQWLFAQKKR